MKAMRFSMAAALLAACCGTALAAGQADTPPAERGQAPGQGMQQGPRYWPNGGFEGRGPGGQEHRFAELRGRMHGRMEGQLHGHMGFPGHLQLNEAQQDKLFAIHHAAAPQHRQQRKAVRRAYETLRGIAGAPQFDEARANAASRELGQAVAAQALLKARVHAQMLAVLTPEQREQLHQRRPQPQRERP